ncbi:MAG TPA: hypothetical protein VFE33_00105 [Thermoanaerobaculia bacterium]|nr:hypothetical protein [Thermoanaerobaculia bacterium]
MNPITILLGLAALGYGLYTAWARRAKPEQFGKLAPMQKAWGEGRGQLLHVVAYTVVPIVVGIVLILSGLAGASFF